MANFEQALAHAEAEYAQLLVEWRAHQPGWLIDWRMRNGAEAYRPLFRCTIDREQPGVVHRSIHPYVGVSTYAPARFR